MKILLPLFLGETELDWSAAPLSELLARRLKMARDLASPQDVRICTDCEHAAQLAASLGLSARLTSAPGQSEILRAALDMLEDAPALSGEPLIVLDLRAATITRSEILLALDEHEKNPDAPVISVERPRDNPVQFRSTYTVEDAGFVLFLEGQERLDALAARLNRPVAAASRPFSLPRDMTDLAMPDGARLLHEKGASARLVWHVRPDAVQGRTVVLSSRCRGAARLSAQVCEDMLHVEAPAMSLVQLVPVQAGTMDADRPLILPVESGEIRLLHSDEAVSGYLYTLESHVGTGSYAISEQHVPARAARPLKVTGRQDFPDVYRHDAALCVGTRPQLLDLERRMETGGVRRLPGESSESVILLTPLDVLRYEVWLESRKDMGKGAL